MKIISQGCLEFRFHYFPIFSSILLRFVIKVTYTIALQKLHSRREGRIYGVGSSIDGRFVIGLDSP